LPGTWESGSGAAAAATRVRRGPGGPHGHWRGGVPEFVRDGDDQSPGTGLGPGVAAPECRLLRHPGPPSGRGQRERLEFPATVDADDRLRITREPHPTALA